MKPQSKPTSNVTLGDGTQITTYYGDDNKPVYQVTQKPNGDKIIKTRKPK